MTNDPQNRRQHSFDTYYCNSTTASSFDSYLPGCSIPDPMLAIVDDPFLKQSELDTMETFFQRELDDAGDLLFNESEQQFLSNFLDGFLETNPLPIAEGLLLQPIPQHVPVPQSQQQSFESTISQRTSESFESTESFDKPTVILAPRKKRHASKQLLTDVEKRQNHVLSEQKRRQNIKMGFDALLKIIPTLKGKSMEEDKKNPPPAKTAILTETIEYLQHLQFRKERLTMRAQELRRLLKSRC